MEYIDYYREDSDGMNEKKPKIVYLEVLRILAIFGVLFCHTENYGVHHYVETTNVVNYWIGIFLASVIQYCIPLFFMISGAVLLNREESIAYVYRHRVLKIAIVTILASLMQYLWDFREHRESMNLKGYFRMLYEGKAATPMWFLFSYLSLLMVLPLLQRLVRAIKDNSWFWYLLLTWCLLNDLLTIPEHYLGWSHTQLNLPILEGYVLASIMGYYVEHRSGELFYKRRNVLILLGISMLLTIVGMYVNYTTLSESVYVTKGNLFAIVYALTLFVIVRYICKFWRMPVFLEKVFCFAGAGAFGTYLIEIQLREFFFPIYYALGPWIHAYPAAFVWIGVSVLAGILIANLFKKIPLIGKLI